MSQSLRSRLRTLLGRLNGSTQLRREIEGLRQQLQRVPAVAAASDRPSPHLDAILQIAQECADRLSDLEALTLKESTPHFTLKTDFPVAISSDDHKFPRGTRNDNSRHPRFVRSVEQIFKRRVAHLDLGCAGGGLILDFLLRGHESAGVEGSDFSLREQRAEWRVVGSHLFTADITKPFRFEKADGTPKLFDAITAWEVLEHIPENLLPGLFANIRSHLTPDGYFVASVATFEDADPSIGAVYHVTVQPHHWWQQRFDAAGMELTTGLFAVEDYVRGSGNPRVGPFGRNDWDVRQNPSLGFHVTARLKRA